MTQRRGEGLKLRDTWSLEMNVSRVCLSCVNRNVTRLGTADAHENCVQHTKTIQEVSNGLPFIA